MTSRQITISIFLIAIMNIIDMSATLLWIDMGIATEANPLLAWCLDQSVWLFTAVKSSIVGLALTCFYYHRALKFTQVGICIVGLGYFALTLYHAYIGFLHL